MFFWLVAVVATRTRGDGLDVLESHYSAPCAGVKVLDRTSPENVVCSEGFNYDNDEKLCIKRDLFPVALACSRGKSLVGKSCVESVEPLETCEPGFELHRDSCHKIEKAEMEPTCPPERTLEDGMCVEKVPMDLVAACPTNCSGEPPECFSTRIFPHSHLCPETWMFEDGRCVLETLVDCTVDGSSDCGDDCYLDTQCSGGSDCFVSRAEIERRLADRQDKFLLGKSDEVCVNRPCKVAVIDRRENTSVELISRTCLKRVEADPDVFCEGPPGTVFNGTQCCLLVPVDTVPACPSDAPGASVDDCFELVHHTPKFVCPADFEEKCFGHGPTFSCQCAARIQRPHSLECGETFTLDSRKCIRHTKPTPYCPEPGAALIDEDTCVQVEREPARFQATYKIEWGAECLNWLGQLRVNRTKND